MGKTKLEKHMEELEEMTSGNSKDAVTFAGKGLDLLKSIIGLSKKAGDAGEEDADEDPEDPADTNEDQGEIKNAGKIEKSVRNGGDLEDADEDPDDPAQAGDDAEGGSIITNKGKKIPKSGSPAVKKNYEFNEQTFEKSFYESYEDVVDASEAVAELAKSVSIIGRAHNSTNTLLKSVMEQNTVLAKALGEVLKAQASMAAEMNELKKQPASEPAPGFVVMQKKADSIKAGSKSLRKSDVQDTITDAMNAGHEDAAYLLKSLGVINPYDQEALQHFVDKVMPEDIREKL